MENKLGNAINNFILGRSEEYSKKYGNVTELIEQHAPEHVDCVVGIMQSKKTAGSSAGAVSKVVNTVGTRWTDYIVATDIDKGVLVLLEIEDGDVIRKKIYEKGEYTLKKESRFLYEIIYAIMPFYKKMRDPFGRNSFVLTSGEDKYKLLLGAIISIDHRRYYTYNENVDLIGELDSLVKALK